MLGQTDIKLSGPNCLIKGSVRYLFWPRGAVKNYRGTNGAVNREILGTAGLDNNVGESCAIKAQRGSEGKRDSSVVVITCI